jgi:uncharacterized protein (DUF433 family)
VTNYYNDPFGLISIDPAVCHGQPCIKGTGVLVTAVLDALVYGAWLVTLADLYSEWRTTSLAYS